jgi:hypothetical protein
VLTQVPISLGFISGHHLFVLLVDDIGQPLTAIMMANGDGWQQQAPDTHCHGGEWRRTVLELSEDLSSRQSLSLSVVKNKRPFLSVVKKKAFPFLGQSRGATCCMIVLYSIILIRRCFLESFFFLFTRSP